MIVNQAFVKFVRWWANQQGIGYLTARRGLVKLQENEPEQYHAIYLIYQSENGS